ncbi:DNA-directed RNA polymerase [Handroanthus impetiginosus]|uniref:DNA-directed RNA polymerase n=1 Tax=Handroanthus impetiginosus TaxID=429701 RepID=A0A2G9GEK5_9LAMI|nr:DNA-directed RNA polymerase [Handroanthus impetiginosus]
MGPFNDVKYHNVIKQSIKITKDPLIPIKNFLGPLETIFVIVNVYLFYHLLIHNQILTFQLIKYYLMDENEKVYSLDQCSNIIFNLNWYFFHSNYCQKTSIVVGTRSPIPNVVSLGQFICKNICVGKNAQYLRSGQVILVQVDSVVIRSAKPYLATPGLSIPGVQIHNGHIEIIVRQIMSKVVLVLEDGIASLNTQSFIFEASFQETARVLTKKALWGQIALSKGLKENIVSGGLTLAGSKD